MRSVYLHKDKRIFQLDKLPTEEFAASLGLPGAPKIKFLSKEIAKLKKNASHAIASALEEVKGKGNEDSEVGSSSEGSESEEEPKKKVRSDQSLSNLSNLSEIFVLERRSHEI